MLYVLAIPAVQHFPDADLHGTYRYDSSHAMQTRIYPAAAQPPTISEKGEILTTTFQENRNFPNLIATLLSIT